MLIVMDHQSTSAQVKAVVRRIEDMGFTANPIPGENRLAIGITGKQ